MNDQNKSLDPVFRCDSCQKLVKLSTIHKRGCCRACGNKRLRSITTLNIKEFERIKQWGFSAFLENFKGVADE